jgi:hypothetical protein
MISAIISKLSRLRLGAIDPASSETGPTGPDPTPQPSNSPERAEQAAAGFGGGLGFQGIEDVTRMGLETTAMAARTTVLVAVALTTLYVETVSVWTPWGFWPRS